MEKLYRHILVPLDGSDLAEVALKWALSLARLTGAKVTFLEAVWLIDSIVEPEHDLTFSMERKRKKEAFRYLESIARRPEYQGINIQAEVMIGQPEEVIVQYARLNNVDLIVMSTHGRTGLKRWFFGSVADSVLRYATQPVLLVRSFSKAGK